jgi:hypothetical protein
LLTNVTQRGSFFGFDTVHFAELFYARQRLTNYTWNVAPGGRLGALSSFYDDGHHVNWGGRFREEVGLPPNWMGYVAVGVESTTIAAVNTIFSFPGSAPVPASFPIQRDFLNYAGSRRALPAERGLAVPWPRRHRLRHAADQQPHRDGAGRERQ